MSIELAGPIATDFAAELDRIFRLEGDRIASLEIR
jgi:hypothetical protein